MAGESFTPLHHFICSLMWHIYSRARKRMRGRRKCVVLFRRFVKCQLLPAHLIFIHNIFPEACDATETFLLSSSAADVLPYELTPAVFLSLQLCIHDNYKNNPFHNFRHCFCVTQMMYSMICLCSLQVNTPTHLRLQSKVPGRHTLCRPVHWSSHVSTTLKGQHVEMFKCRDI